MIIDQEELMVGSIVRWCSGDCAETRVQFGKESI